MEAFFKKLNDNSTVMMYTTIINDLIKDDNKNQMSAIYNLFLKMKSVDKTVLNDKNLGLLEALEYLFDDKDTTFEEKSKSYKKNFLHMLNSVYQHESLYVFNSNKKTIFTIDEDSQELNLQFGEEKLCNRKDNSLVLANIEELKQIPSDNLMEKYEEYQIGEYLFDVQVAFVLRNYLKEIQVSENYRNDLQRWAKQIVVYGTIPAYNAKQFYNLDSIVLDYFDELMTQRVQADLGRNDVFAYAFVDDDCQFSLLITKQHKKQKSKNIK